MRNVNAIVMNCDEFVDIMRLITNGHANIEMEDGEWFYVSDDEYDVSNVIKDLSEYLKVNVKAIRIDLTNDEDDVIIICE